MQSLGKSNIPSYTRENTSYNKEKGKAIELEEKATSKDPMENIASMLEEVMTTQNQFRAEQSMQMNKIQNRIVTLERNSGPKNFQPK